MSNSKAVTRSSATHDLDIMLYNFRLNMLEALNTPRALSLAICLRYSYIDAENYMTLYDLLDHSDLMYYDGRSSPYENVSYVRANLQAIALFSKADDLPEMPHLEEKARESFFESEQHNRETNTRFLTGDVSGALIMTASSIISNILGQFPISVYAKSLRFGPGVTNSCRGLSATIAHKLESDIFCTPRSEKIVADSLGHSFQYYYALSSINTTVFYNTFLTVPKRFKEKRGICIGLHGNIVVQLAYGNCIRHRFKRYVDLNRTADFHRQLVKKEWMKIATIDIRKASQQIARRAVQAVWPEQWLTIMDNIREEYTLVPPTCEGPPVLNYNQHYSAMGNGFTFEMESVLFYAIAKAAMLNKGLKWEYLSVFGDDIIVDKHCADTVIAALKDFGFVINDEKSFTDGPFKESCGMDTLRGHNVRPYFIRNTNGKKLIEVAYGLANLASRVAARSGNDICLDSTFYRSWISVIRSIPEHRRYFSSNIVPAKNRLFISEPSERRENVCYEWSSSPIPEDDTVIYIFGGRKAPGGVVNRYRLKRIVSKKWRYKPAVGDIQLGAALLGSSPDGDTPRNVPRYSIGKQKLKYLSSPFTMVWTI